MQENYNNTQQNQGHVQRNKGTHLNIPKPKTAGNNLNNRTINQQGNVGQGQKQTNQQNSAQGTKLNDGNQQNKGPGNQLHVGKGLQLNNGQGNYTNGQKKNQSSGGQGSNRNSSPSTQYNKTKLNLSNGNQTNNGQLNGGQINEQNLVENGKSLKELIQEFSTTRFIEIPVKLSTVTSQPQFYLKQKQAAEKSTMSQTVSEKKSYDDKSKKNTKNQLN